MNPILLSSLIHSLEALVVAGISIAVSYFFPEHRAAAGLSALTALSLFVKSLRAAKTSPVADYVNDVTK